MPDSLRLTGSLLSGILPAGLYLILTHSAFRSLLPPEYFQVMASGFLILAPFAIGALTVALAPERARRSTAYAALAPWIPCTLSVMLVALLRWEAWVCVAMALPIFWIMSTLGGLAASASYRIGRPTSERNTM